MKVRQRTNASTPPCVRRGFVMSGSSQLSLTNPDDGVSKTVSPLGAATRASKPLQQRHRSAIILLKRRAQGRCKYGWLLLAACVVVSTIRSTVLVSITEMFGRSALPRESAGAYRHLNIHTDADLLASNLLRGNGGAARTYKYSSRIVYLVPRTSQDQLTAVNASYIDIPASTTKDYVRIFELDYAFKNRNEDAEANHWELPQDGCLPLGEWQIQSNPTCNSIHEINLMGAAENDATSVTSFNPTNRKFLEQQHWPNQHFSTHDADLRPLGEGWFRTTWKVTAPLPGEGTLSQHQKTETVVLKMLRIGREFLPEYYELHRRDVVAMERLTRSEFVMDVYGYCGQSAINEIAMYNGIWKTMTGLTERSMTEGLESSAARNFKLRIATSVALGVADIHAGGIAEDATQSKDAGVASMVHYDLNPYNVALTQGGRPKINDFNIVEFLRYRPDTNECCGFSSRLKEPWWRSPEEMPNCIYADHPKAKIGSDSIHPLQLTEKVDVYALGNILYSILTAKAPRGKEDKEARIDHVRGLLAQGIPPALPERYAVDPDPIYVAFRQAMDLCFIGNSNQRASAIDVARVLSDALLQESNVEERVIGGISGASRSSSNRKVGVEVPSSTSYRGDRSQSKDDATVISTAAVMNNTFPSTSSPAWHLVLRTARALLRDQVLENLPTDDE